MKQTSNHSREIAGKPRARIKRGVMPLKVVWITGAAGGHIINVSSFAGRQGSRGQSNYAAAKAGLLGLTGSLARELGSHNIRVNAVLPGVLPTPMTAGLTGQQLNELASANVLRCINTIDEVARFIVFLAAMRNVSDQVFQLDSRIVPWT